MRMWAWAQANIVVAKRRESTREKFIDFRNLIPRGGAVKAEIAVF